eukprot:362298-Chlamydomonas_euryale.AAC.9
MAKAYAIPTEPAVAPGRSTALRPVAPRALQRQKDHQRPQLHPQQQQQRVCAGGALAAAVPGLPAPPTGSAMAMQASCTCRLEPRPPLQQAPRCAAVVAAVAQCCGRAKTPVHVQPQPQLQQHQPQKQHRGGRNDGRRRADGEAAMRCAAAATTTAVVTAPRKATTSEDTAAREAAAAPPPAPEPIGSAHALRRDERKSEEVSPTAVGGSGRAATAEAVQPSPEQPRPQQQPPEQQQQQQVQHQQGQQQQQQQLWACIQDLGVCAATIYAATTDPPREERATAQMTRQRTAASEEAAGGSAAGSDGQCRADDGRVYQLPAPKQAPLPLPGASTTAADAGAVHAQHDCEARVERALHAAAGAEDEGPVWQALAANRSPFSLGWLRGFEDVYELRSHAGHGSFGQVRLHAVTHSSSRCSSSSSSMPPLGESAVAKGGEDAREIKMRPHGDHAAGQFPIA